MKTLDLINMMIFNNFKILAKKRYSSHTKDDYIYLNVNNIYYIYNCTKSYDECRLLMKKLINYGLVEDWSFYGENGIELVIKIYL
jgi:hypothetical protein